MANLIQASQELFHRSPDERHESLVALGEHCQRLKDQSRDRWHHPQSLHLDPLGGRLELTLGNDGAFLMNDWSFSQLCKLAGISRDTVNRLSPETASTVFDETLPHGGKPLQVLTTSGISGKTGTVRSIHGVAYTRLWNADLVAMLREFAVDFQPPQKGFNGATGLYAGEQDMFCFLIDPNGWAEIGDQAFAPGFFVWNSEVGKRSIGISTFWFQAVCANHIVWDAVEVTEFTRKHTGGVYEALGDIRRIVETLVAKRDQRKDGFVRVLKKAMEQRLGNGAEEVEKVLAKSGISRQLAKRALELAQEQGRFTIFAVVDALTRLARDIPNAGDRTEADQQAAQLLGLAT
jgi:hypothetical protein